MSCQFIWTKLKCITVEPVLFFYMLNIFLESNALQELIFVKTCINIVNPANISDCSSKDQSNFTDLIKQEKASWVGYNNGVLFFFTFFGSFYVASWSDKFGRKFPMLIPPIGTLIAGSINCVLCMFIRSPIEYLLITATISGLSFGTVGIISSTFGFITDVSDESSRTKRFVILEAMIHIGGTLGIYVGREFLKNVDYSLTINGFSQLFIFQMSVSVVIIFYVIFRIPSQSASFVESSTMTCWNLFNIEHIKDTVKAVFRHRDAGKRKHILLLFLVLCCVYFGLVVQLTLTYYYLQDVLHWTFSKYCDLNSIQFVVQGLLLLVGLPLAFHFWKINDCCVAALGIVSRMAGYLTLGLSNSNALVYSCIGFYMFSEFPVPAIRSMLSKTVDADEKGRIFAFTTILQNFCFLVGSLALTSIYKSTTTIFPGMCFEIVAGLQACALAIIGYLYITRGEVVTVYEIMRNEDGSEIEHCEVIRTSGPIN